MLLYEMPNAPASWPALCGGVSGGCRRWRRAGLLPMILSPDDGPKDSESRNQPGPDQPDAVRDGTGAKARPKALDVRPNDVPDELVARDQWVNWRYDLNDKDDWAKVPYRCVSTYKASS